VARATSGSSALAIHAVKLVPPTAPVLSDIAAGDCPTSVTFGACRAARANVGEYAWEVPGPDVLAVHVLDGLGQSESPADVAPMDAPPIDDGNGQNAGVIGASVYRAQKQTFVVEPAAVPGPTTSLSYGVPGANPSRHVVFDAPADAMGRTAVTATVAGDRCVVTLAPGEGITGAPAIFTLSAASGGCAFSADADVAPGSVSPGSGGFDHPGGGGGPGSGGGGSSGTGGSAGAKGNVSGGCSCGVAGGAWSGAGAAGAALAAFGAALASRRRRRTRR
jgi:hypothetical protein